ncbi:VWA domain-containing protein [Bacillus sp. CLL-7-23]|uniref:VWA domain-containing protein n=2 Tax=Bacillus changyiensis TaxID=3004103 RepID=A0ABT4X7V6_9BACI|nr:VWA domain-containing protein [Bacillus changyiensis]MDA7028368.1 VWA domain-containing protein [Bacillus changyiensis]
MKKGHLNQILLITDGCSNRGEDPQAIAAFAKEQGITVNVIGIMEEGSMDQSAMSEVEGIALAGGGVHQVVYASQLSQTVQMVTKKAMTQTLQGVVNQELKQILGKQTEMDELPPDQRGEVMEVVDELGETVHLHVLVLVDTSASMNPKLPTVKEALIDLSISLNSRIGDNEFAMFIFPGKKQEVELVQDWTPKFESLSSLFSRLAAGGITPTGPAIRAAINYFNKNRSRRSMLEDDEKRFDKFSS